MDLETAYWRLPVGMQNLACSAQGWLLQRRRYGSRFLQIENIYAGRERLAPPMLRTFQGERLRAHLLAAAKTPFWRERFTRHGIDPAAADPWSELARLPVLTKADVQANSDRLVNPTLSPRDLVAKHTSGTTGAGLNFHETREAEREQWAVWWRYRGWHGIQRDEWCAYFGGRSVVPIEARRPPYWRTNWPGRQIMFSAYHLSSETAGDYLDEIARRKLPWLHGYPSILSLLASLVREVRPAYRPNIRIVTTGAESLLEHQRRLIQEVFQCPIRQHYGLAEATANASECIAGRLHIDEDFSLVELVESGPDRPLRIVGTNWSNPAFPLLRYDSGDLATPDTRSCSCGNNGRVLAAVDGRIEDFVVLASGARVGRLDHIFKDFTDIAEAQVRQERPGAVTLRIGRGKGYSSQTEARLIHESRKRLGDDMEIRVEYPVRIERTSSEKLRFVVSKVGPNR